LRVGATVVAPAVGADEAVGAPGSAGEAVSPPDGRSSAQITKTTTTAAAAAMITQSLVDAMRVSATVVPSSP
jgi:hypothetical protein